MKPVMCFLKLSGTERKDEFHSTRLTLEKIFGASCIELQICDADNNNPRKKNEKQQRRLLSCLYFILFMSPRP
jgi:hypothetical protein